MTGRRARTAGIVGLLLMAAMTVVHPRLKLLDPATRARHRWWVEALEEGRVGQAWASLFADASGRPLEAASVLPRPTGYSGRVPVPRVERAARFVAARVIDTDEGPVEVPASVSPRWGAYESSPSVTPDPWGQPWRLVVDAVVLDGRRHRVGRPLEVHSAGPDRRHEFGQGDDIVVGPLYVAAHELDVRDGVRRPVGVPWDTEPAWLAAAGLLAWLWATWAAWAAPRPETILAELGLAALATPLPAALAVLAARRADLHGALPVARPGLLVDPAVAIELTIVALVGGLVFWRRLRRPRSAEAAA